MGADALVTIVPAGTKEKTSETPETLSFIYETLQMTNTAFQITESESVLPPMKVFALWILIPLAIACLLLYLSLKYCLHNYHKLEYADFIEEEIPEPKSKSTSNHKESGKSLN